ncbi:cell division protein DivIVA [Mycolicibacterium litorale]|uniref:Cell division protein DivIVA n=1 Tax=Mycolicibacterium litorale TaxID=758802 RepID=A0A6S6NXP4_9MYCO|nr:DivIVA domain-containing protein [Mycolicibacterium litorale]BCI50775.1 cell division protein DivIVA [Mycolicibacterium litorale]
MSEPSGGLTADAVRNATFSKPPLGRRGYDPKSVRDFLALTARRLEGRGHLCADDVRAIRFPKPPIGRRGYHDGEVDAYMATVADAVAALDAG